MQDATTSSTKNERATKSSCNKGWLLAPGPLGSSGRRRPDDGGACLCFQQGDARLVLLWAGGRYSTWCREESYAYATYHVQQGARPSRPDGAGWRPRRRGGDHTQAAQPPRYRTHCAACSGAARPEHAERNPRTACSTIPAVAVSTKAGISPQPSPVQRGASSQQERRRARSPDLSSRSLGGIAVT